VALKRRRHDHVLNPAEFVRRPLIANWPDENWRFGMDGIR